MLQALFHAWERRLSDSVTNRVVRPFEWGLDWLPHVSADMPPADAIAEWVSRVMADTDAFFSAPPTSDYTLAAPSAEGDCLLSFPSALETPHPENNTVYCRYFPERTSPRGAGADGTRAAVLVL